MISRRAGAPATSRALVAIRLIGRGVMAGAIVAVLVFLTALPDEAPATSPSRGSGMVSMQAPSSVPTASRMATVSASPADAEQPPGDGRKLGDLLPTILRLSHPAGLAAAEAGPAAAVGAALPERPPKLV